MSLRKIFLIFSILLIAAGCASTLRVPMTGTTRCNMIQARSVQLAMSMKKSIEGCNKVDKIETRVVSEPAGKGDHRAWKEEWTVYACGKTTVYFVTFEQNGRSNKVEKVSIDKE